MKQTMIIFATLFFIGCASEKVLNPVAAVQGAQDSVDKTNDFVERANTTITNFEKDIHALRKEAMASTEMRAKAKFSYALTIMDQKLAESRRDLATLKFRNTESWGEYKHRLNSAKEDMHETFNEKSE